MQRRGREFYTKEYDQAMELHSKGLSVRDISDKLGISYSCVYHWVKGLRKPESGNLTEFEKFLSNGPKPVAEIKDRFPKHNELFLTASRRGFPIKRYAINRRFGDYSTWYFLDGQEIELKNRIKELLNQYKEVKEKIIKALEGLIRNGRRI